MTLGFKPKHQYNAKQLKAVCSVLSEILRNKGSIKALKIACEALFNSMDINQALDYNFTDGKDKTELNLYIPQNFGNINLINDLLYYILPAGMNCNIIRELHLNSDAMTKLSTIDKLTIYERGDKEGYFGTASKYYVYSDNSMAKLVRLESDSDTNIYKGVLNTGDAIRSLVADNPGFIMNSTLYKHEDTVVPNVVADTKEDE
jgi:hypothetical protein